ncbi:MAG: cation transporter [Clostridiales bacterium]|nr:cation transporter [Clostridiales bacterium]
MCQECGCGHGEGVMITIPVGGMSCEHCVRAVEGALAEVAGVSRIRVDLTTGTVTFTLTEEGDIQAVKQAIQEEGYEV